MARRLLKVLSPKQWYKTTLALIIIILLTKLGHIRNRTMTSKCSVIAEI